MPPEILERNENLGYGPPPNGASCVFNRSPLEYSGSIEQPSSDIIKTTMGLWNASLDDAIKFGGDLTRMAIGAANLRHDKKYCIVDTKVHMLMPGMSPAIPGWHTDGVPRGSRKNPQDKAPPDIKMQEAMESPRFHLLVTGTGCLTVFALNEIKLVVPCPPSTDLYASVDKQMKLAIERDEVKTVEAQSCRVCEWDWWQLHTAKVATIHEWRWLIRITETDYQTPEHDLRRIIRQQQSVYVPQNFGW